MQRLCATCKIQYNETNIRHPYICFFCGKLTEEIKDNRIANMHTPTGVSETQHYTKGEQGIWNDIK